MTRVARYDSGDRFDDPELVYGPAAAPESPHMSDDNRISATMTTADIAAVLAAIATIREKCPFLISLTPDERSHTPSIGDKTTAFDGKAQTSMTQNSTFVPGFVNMTEFQKDIDLRAALQGTGHTLLPLAQDFADTMQLVGHDVYLAELAFYQNTQSAAKRGQAGAKTISEDLQARFPGGSHATAAKKAAAKAA